MKYIGIVKETSIWFFMAGEGVWRFIEGLASMLEYSSLPESFRLSNTPTPFNPSTVIGFGLASPLPVRLAVYSAAGQRVRELVCGRMSAGHHSVVWDGRNNAGTPVSSGVYFYRLEAGGRSETRKMMLMR
jgi:hypothetical protein